MSAPGDLPDWALAHASAALKIGRTVPQIEQQLVAKGLAPSTATAVVNAVLEGRLQTGSASSVPREGVLTAHRVASVPAVCLCLGLAYAFGGGQSVGRTTLWLLLPVACIWWAEVFADNAPPPPIRWVAWLVVLFIAGYRVVLLSI
jgi:hypothetical protein